MLRSILWAGRVLVLLFALALVPTDADGKFFAFKAAPGTPFQQALLIHQDGVETLVLQSAWKSENPLEKLLWIVPVPAVPEIGGMEEHHARKLFRFHLSQASSPQVNHWGPGVLLALWIGVFLYLIWLRFIKKRVRVGSYLVLFVIISVLLVLLTPTISVVRGSNAPWVIQSGSTGAYDYQVIGATDAKELTKWFEERGYPVTTEDAPIFEDYLKRDWRFVAVKSTETRQENQGLAPVLALRFSTKEAVYPLALTSTNGLDTKILLFCLSDHRLDSKGRLPCIRAKETKGTLEELLRESFLLPYSLEHPEAILKPPAKPFPTYLTTFWGTMSAKDMRTDLVLTPALSDEEYRQVIWQF